LSCQETLANLKDETASPTERYSGEHYDKEHRGEERLLEEQPPYHPQDQNPAIQVHDR
jgi:hypothetical protein